jgi:hypothetical protein
MTNYSIESDIKFGFLKLMDVGALMDEMQPWSNRVLCRVNDSVVRLGVVQGEFHWHKHDWRTSSSMCSRAASISIWRAAKPSR